MTSAQSLNTETGYTSGPVTFGVNEEGEHLVKWTTHAMSTDCLITPTASLPVQKRLNALACLPTWVQHQGAPYLASFPQDGTKLKLIYTPGLYDVANRALGAWRSALHAAGPHEFRL